MTDRIRTLGGFTIAFGVFWLAAGIAGSIIADAVVAESPNRVDHELADVVQAGLIWAGVLLAILYGAAGAGLLMGASWGRAAAFSLWLFSMLVPLLGWALGIATLAVLMPDREDPEFGISHAT